MRYLLIIALLWPNLAFGGWMQLPGPVNQNASTAPSEAIYAENTSESSLASTGLDNTNAKGNSFTVSANIYLTALEVKASSGVEQNITFRVGTAADLSSGYEEATGTSLAVDGTWQRIDFAGTTELNASTTYYFGAIKTTASAWYINRNNADVYANGTYHQPGTGWAMSSLAGYDLQFRLYGIAR